MRTASSGLRRRRSKAAGKGKELLARRRASRFSRTRNPLSLLFRTPATRATLLEFLKVLYFFSWLVMPFKGPFIPLGATFTGQKFYRWYHDNWPIGQWVICHAAPDTAYVNHFFPREIIIWFKSIQVDPCATSCIEARFAQNLWEVDL